MDEKKYKIIRKTENNDVVNDIFLKINGIRSTNKIWLQNNLKIFVFKHLKLPLYSLKDVEDIISEYGIQKALQHYVLNKKKYEEILDFVESDEGEIVYGIAYSIIYELFEYRIVDNE